MSFVTACPLCLTIFMMDGMEGDECPNCDVGILMNYDEYVLRLNCSFMDALEEERGNNVQ